jgi:hypothetical protein
VEARISPRLEDVGRTSIEYGRIPTKIMDRPLLVAADVVVMSIRHGNRRSRGRRSLHQLVL